MAIPQTSEFEHPTTGAVPKAPGVSKNQKLKKKHVERQDGAVCGSFLRVHDRAAVGIFPTLAKKNREEPYFSQK